MRVDRQTAIFAMLPLKPMPMSIARTSHAVDGDAAGRKCVGEGQC